MHARAIRFFWLRAMKQEHNVRVLLQGSRVPKMMELGLALRCREPIELDKCHDRDPQLSRQVLDRPRDLPHCLPPRPVVIANIQQAEIIQEYSSVPFSDSPMRPCLQPPKVSPGLSRIRRPPVYLPAAEMIAPISPPRREPYFIRPTGTSERIETSLSTS